MNRFFRLLQPTIVQASDEMPNPELRGRYFINFNVVGIPYFEENYILLETSFGSPYLILKENDWGLLLENSEFSDVIDIPRIYIDITDKFVNDKDNLFQSFVYQAIMKNQIWGRGIDGFFAGKDYYTNETLWVYLATHEEMEVFDTGAKLPNYLNVSGEITKYWRDLSGEVFKDYNNLDYFNEKNKLLTNTYPEDELNNFYSNFCKIILENTTIFGTGREYQGDNPIYNLVLNYYKNFQSDCASDALAMILGSGYTTSTSTSSSCCNSNCFNIDSTSNSTTIQKPCKELYDEAMQNWLIKMLSDKQFYYDWFMIWESEDEYIPNDVLDNKLITFINEFISLQNVLSFLPTKYKNNLNCPNIIVNDSDCNYNILKNYLNVLQYNLEDKLDENTNKIKVYGTQFAELLPKLQF